MAWPSRARAQGPISPVASRYSVRTHKNRCASTPSKQALWHAIRGRALGVQFRRQVPIGAMFIDAFVASELKLVVQVDGRSHNTRQAADARRDTKLGKLGYVMLRLPAELIERRLAVAVERVRHCRVAMWRQRLRLLACRPAPSPRCLRQLLSTRPVRLRFPRVRIASAKWSWSPARDLSRPLGSGFQFDRRAVLFGGAEISDEEAQHRFNEEE